MSRSDPSTSEVLAALSAPAPKADLSFDFSRRRFLQGSSVAATLAMLPTWLVEHAAAASPLGASEGVLVLMTMGGGNDGLNTFIPSNQGAYYDARGRLAIARSEVLDMGSGRGMHPELKYFKTLWDRKQLAVVDGVGQPNDSLSHFVSMAQIMAANGQGRPGNSGWLGRILDGIGDQPLNGVSLGSSVPLVAQGQRRNAVAIPENGNDLRRLDGDYRYQNQYNVVRDYGRASHGLGPLADRVADSYAEALQLASVLSPLVDEDSGDEPRVVQKMRLAARLINADIGVRVISVVFGDFDSHANQPYMHAERMRELNAAVQAFHSELLDKYSGRTLVAGTSEFGRRVASNGSGTDHGTANAMFAIGSGVNGGFYGALPSLTKLDSDRNLVPSVDFRQFYANLTTQWLNADSAAILGQDYASLGFLKAPSAQTSPTPVVSNPIPVAAGSLRAQRAEIARLYLAYFLRFPDDEGLEHWTQVRRSGRSLARISNNFAASAEFKSRYGSVSNREFVRLIYRNVLERSPDLKGFNHWSGRLDAGASRGQVMAAFSESVEFKRKSAAKVTTIENNGPVGRLYRAYFLRAPDPKGMDYWLNRDMPARAISEQFAASGEFKRRYGALNNDAFVNLIYRNVLGRNPDVAGKRHWLGVLNRGASRGAVMANFANSAEFIRKVRSL